ALRAFMALARAGVDLGPEAEGAGMAGLAVAGLRALGTIDFAEAEALLDEMMGCVKILRGRDVNNPLLAEPLMETDIEEVATRVLLRTKIFELHTGFTLAGGRSGSTSAPATTPASSPTPT